MPNKQNQESLERIKQDLSGVTAMWVVDYRGLTVKEIQQLRRDVRASGARMVVYKNTLMHLALEQAGQPTLDELLEGPNAFIFAADDAAAAAKAVKNFAKDNSKLEIKGGLMEGAQVSAAEVEAIASLPTRDELIGQIAGAISGIARGLAVAINGVPRGLAQSINQVCEQKQAA